MVDIIHSQYKITETYLKFNPDWGFASHVQLPTLNDKLYFASRDYSGKSHINCIGNKFETFLSPKESFDQDGCMPSCFLDEFCFYTGWEPGMPYKQSVCLYVKNRRYKLIDNGDFLANSPSVIFDGVYKMWFISSRGWQGCVPMYSVDYAESSNIFDWEIVDRNCIPLSEVEFPSRPHVVKNDKYEMYFSTMGLDKRYSLQYASSEDGKVWARGAIKIDSDEDMLCYPFYSDGRLLINGADFGKHTIFLAEQYV